MRSVTALLVALLMFASQSSLLQAQFDPDLATSFTALEAGAAAGIEQDFTFYEGEVGPSMVTVAIERGAFDFGGVVTGDVVGALTLDVFYDAPFPLADIEGQVLADLEVTSVSTDELAGDMVVTEIDSSVLTLLAILGIADPTGEAAFTVTLTNRTGGGAEIVATESGTLPIGEDALLIDLPALFEFDALFVHGDAGELAVTTTVLSVLDDEVEFEETFEIVGSSGEPAIFLRGDGDGDGEVESLSDPVFILRYLFSGGAAPPCAAAADCDGNDSISLSDPLLLLKWAFQGGAAPTDPGPETCGDDPSTDDGCETPPDCA